MCGRCTSLRQCNMPRPRPLADWVNNLAAPVTTHTLALQLQLQLQSSYHSHPSITLICHSTALVYSVFCNTALYWTNIYCTLLYSIPLYCTVVYCTILLQCCATFTVCYLLSTVQYCTVHYCTVLYLFILYCIVLHCTFENIRLLGKIPINVE